MTFTCNVALTRGLFYIQWGLTILLGIANIIAHYAANSTVFGEYETDVFFLTLFLLNIVWGTDKAFGLWTEQYFTQSRECSDEITCSCVLHGILFWVTILLEMAGAFIVIGGQFDTGFDELKQACSWFVGFIIAFAFVESSYHCYLGCTGKTGGGSSREH